MDHDPIAAHLLKPHRFSDQTSLRFAIAPERVEEVFDPLDLASPDFAERMMEIGHRRDVRLFGYRYAKEAPRLEQTGWSSNSRSEITGAMAGRASGWRSERMAWS